MKKLGTLLLTGGILLTLASPAYAQQPAGTEAIGVGTPALAAAAEEQAEAAALSATNGVVASGNCGAQGNNLTWALDNTGTLTINGKGKMESYVFSEDYDLTPWSFWKDSITSIIIGEGVTSIGESAFYGCSSLTAVTLPNSLTSIETAAFYWCSSLTEIEIPDSVTSIGEWAFAGCGGLTKIDIPNNVTIISDSAFSSCSSLTKIWIPNSVTNIGGYAFYGCSSLTEIVIPKSVVSIGMGAFGECSSLAEITIPEGITKIGNSAFNWCTSLRKITIPKSVTSIENFAFCDCSNLSDVYYGGTKEQWAKISIGTFNTDLTSATIHYNSGSGSGSGSGSSSSGGSSGSSGGCYVATAVYGSYDCPEVWTLRRYRDYELSQTAAGRAFVRTYYAVSPTIVEYFGDEEWFQDMWRGPLDKMVSDLQAKGYESTPYEDIAW